MRNEITLKKYDVDYSFIIRNYLSPELWKKTWTLFVYKNIRINLNLYYIEVQEPIKINFNISINAPGYSYSTFKTYTLGVSNLTILKNQINNAILYLIECYENNLITHTDEYQKLYDASIIEEDKLREIAEEYLDDNGIRIDDVRSAYIDWYVDNNSTGNDYLYDYKSSMKYKQCTDLWLVYANAIHDNNLIETIKNKLAKNDYEDVLNNIKEYIDILSDEYSDEYDSYFEDKASYLENI